MNKKNDICPACECDPCDCSWGNYLTRNFSVARTFRRENHNKKNRKNKISRKRINKKMRQEQRRLLKTDSHDKSEIINIETDKKIKDV